MELSGQTHTLAAVSPGKRIRGWVGPRDGLEVILFFFNAVITFIIHQYQLYVITGRWKKIAQ
jgi:hypothetical protein